MMWSLCTYEFSFLTIPWTPPTPYQHISQLSHEYKQKWRATTIKRTKCVLNFRPFACLERVFWGFRRRKVGNFIQIAKKIKWHCFTKNDPINFIFGHKLNKDKINVLQKFGQKFGVLVTSLWRHTRFSPKSNISASISWWQQIMMS